MAQLGGIVMMDPENAAAKKNFFFGGIDGCKFRRPVVPGDTLVRCMPSPLSLFGKNFTNITSRDQVDIHGSKVQHTHFESPSGQLRIRRLWELPVRTLCQALFAHVLQSNGFEQQ